MASWTFATEAAPDLRGLSGLRQRRALIQLAADRGTDVLLAVGVLTLMALLLAFLPRAFSVDSWLALVTGRDVWQSGIPHHDTLTALSYGAPWVDQQWLSQVLSYGAYLAGGLALMAAVNALLVSAALAGCVVGARRLGASAASVLLALPVCAVLVMYSWEVRTQNFVLPLFVATAYLLASDSRRSSHRVYWCLPLLVLWANLHGTVSLGAALVALRGLTLLWERRGELRDSGRAWLRPLVLLIAAPATLLATPYGLSTISYYRATLLGSTLRHAVTEWQPITSVPVLAGVLLLVAGLALWAFGRYPGRTTLWERLAMVALAAASVDVLRNALFFGLFALLILPLALPLKERRDGSAPAGVRFRRARLNLALAGVSLFVALLMGTAAVTRPNSAIELSFQRTGVLQVVQQQTARDPGLKVFADVRFADWLLWRDPALAGRIANDARFELLTAGQINRVQDAVDVSGPRWKQGLRHFRLIVLDREYTPQAVTELLQEPGHRVLYSDGQRIVILRTAGEAR